MSEKLKVGPYETLLELAAGGMGTVYIARKVGPQGFERLTVLKRVHRHLLKDQDFLDMVRDEAKIASLISHPNVVGVEDVLDTGSELVLAQPYIESVSLSSLLRAAARGGERLAPKVVVRILTDVLAGLHAAHEAKDLRGEVLHVVHRDVSPHNVLIGTDGRSRLIDFGIAKAERRVTHTKTGVVKGKLAYMAPEALRGTPLDRRADIFSAAVMLHEALTGEKVFQAEDEGDLLLAIMVQEIKLPSTVDPTLAGALDSAVLKALERSPDDRFGTAVELQEALEQALPPAPPKEVQEIVERLFHEHFRELRNNIRKCLDGAAKLEPASDITVVERWAHSTETVDPTATATKKAAPEVSRSAASERTVLGENLPSEHPRAMRRWWVLVALIALVFCGVLAFRWGWNREDRPPDSTAAFTVALTTQVAPSAATTSLSAEPEPVQSPSPTDAPPSSASRKPAAPAKTTELHKNPY